MIQIGLGAWTIWSNKAADIATAHVATGAGIFILSGLVTIIGYRARFDVARMNRGARLPGATPMKLAKA